MTLRILLKELHALAATVGADTEAEVRGLAKQVRIDRVAIGEDDVPAIYVRRRITAEQKQNRQLGYGRARYHRCKEQRICYRCNAPLGDRKAAECKTCALKSSAKRSQRYHRSKT